MADRGVEGHRPASVISNEQKGTLLIKTTPTFLSDHIWRGDRSDLVVSEIRTVFVFLLGGLLSTSLIKSAAEFHLAA